MLINYIIKIIKSLLSKIGFRGLFYATMLAALTILTLYIKSCHNKIPISAIPAVIENTINYKKDGVVHSTIEQKFYTEQEMKYITDSIRKEDKASLVTTVTNVVTKVDTIFEPVPFAISDGKIHANRNDKYLDLSFDGDVNTQKGNFGIHFTPDTLNINYIVKNHLFKPNEHKIDLTHSNPYFTTTQGNSYTFKESKPYLVIGPSVGVSMSLNQGKIGFKPVLGVTATIPVITFKKK